MRYLSLVMLLIALLLIAACDRFDHDYEVLDFQNELFLPMQTAMTNHQDLSILMDFYADDYMHNAASKADREQFYHSLFTLYGEDIILVPTLQSYNHHNLSLNWELIILDASTEPASPITAIAFSDDKVLRVGNDWKLYGNRIADLEQGNKRRLIFESFTFTTCPNCPRVENLMHGLASLYPTQFSYLEYHFNDPLAIPATNQIFGYYGFSVMPATILNGQTKIIGGDPQHLDAMRSFVEGMLSSTPELFLEDLQTTYTAGTGLSGSVRLVVGPGFDHSNLKLRYHLIERSSSATNSAGNPCTNVVLASGTLDIAGADLNQAISFDLGYTGTLPSDASLIFYAQRMPTPWASNAPILNAREIPLTR